MPNSIDQLQLIETISLENNNEQLLFKTAFDLDLQPGAILILNKNVFPILWQITTRTFLCLNRNQNINAQQKIWNDFSFHCSDIIMKGDPNNQLTLLICKGDGLIHALHQVYNWRKNLFLPDNLLIFSEVLASPPFKLQPSRIFSSLAPAEATATIALLDDWKIATRFSSKNWQPGCFQGEVSQMVDFVETLNCFSSICKFQFNGSSAKPLVE